MLLMVTMKLHYYTFDRFTCPLCRTRFEQEKIYISEMSKMWKSLDCFQKNAYNFVTHFIMVLSIFATTANLGLQKDVLFSLVESKRG